MCELVWYIAKGSNLAEMISCFDMAFNESLFAVTFRRRHIDMTCQTVELTIHGLVRAGLEVAFLSEPFIGLDLPFAAVRLTITATDDFSVVHLEISSSWLLW